MEIGDRVIIKNGASEWMKLHNYWLEEMGDSIDGFWGTINCDCTDSPGNDSHFEVDINFGFKIGINPKWLKKV